MFHGRAQGGTCLLLARLAQPSGSKRRTASQEGRATVLVFFRVPVVIAAPPELQVVFGFGGRSDVMGRVQPHSCARKGPRTVVILAATSP